ncbi:hypothetical protein TNIN_130471 [Trichonephila inaurata madagascariensis]|uniref:Uncharacterized protein n=1 Tax=Trichonephila inaurata madagascariensis TaxID=2747483 RepID=A0A8X6WZ16_9ARAC|nr:hypothetical protein TNIN_130471 [Trichonephila inaurata madagascariensis]
MSVIAKSKKDVLKLVAEELKLTVPDNARDLDLKILIECSEVYKKDKELVKNIIDYAVEETKIKKEPEHPGGSIFDDAASLANGIFG